MIYDFLLAVSIQQHAAAVAMHFAGYNPFTSELLNKTDISVLQREKKKLKNYFCSAEENGDLTNRVYSSSAI